MKNRIRTVAAMVMTAVFLLPVIAFAADTNVSISGGSSVKEGETTTVTVTYKGDSLGFVDGELRYDSDSLEYLSGGSSQGNNGVVQLKRWSDNASGVITFSLKFRGLREGAVDLDLKTYETQNLDGIGMSRPSANKSLKVMEGEQQTTVAQTTETQEITTADTETQTEGTESAGQENLATVESEWNTAEEPTEAEEEAQDNLSTYLPIVIAILLIVIVIAVVVIRKKKR